MLERVSDLQTTVDQLTYTWSGKAKHVPPQDPAAGLLLVWLKRSQICPGSVRPSISGSEGDDALLEQVNLALTKVTSFVQGELRNNLVWETEGDIYFGRVGPDI